MKVHMYKKVICTKKNDDQHCVKSFRIWSYSGSYFSAFGLNTEGYSVFSPNAGKCGPE